MLAGARCAAVRNYLAAKGFCPWRILNYDWEWISAEGHKLSSQSEPLVLFGYSEGGLSLDTLPPCTAGAEATRQ